MNQASRRQQSKEDKDARKLLNLFPRVEGGPIPFLLLDGHGSRFQLPFMRYIEDNEHKWKVCIGVPNGTAHWQVGDSAEQNGSWKMATTHQKS
jgi:hypothetical protein